MNKLDSFRFDDDYKPLPFVEFMKTQYKGCDCDKKMYIVENGEVFVDLS